MTSIRIKQELLDAMRAIKDTEGIPMAVQIEFALRDWLDKRGNVKSERKRVAARKHS